MNDIKQRIIDVCNNSEYQDTEDSTYEKMISVNLDIPHAIDIKDGYKPTLTLEFTILCNDLINNVTDTVEDFVIEVLATGEDAEKYKDNSIEEFEETIRQKINKWEEFARSNKLDNIFFINTDDATDIWVQDSSKLDIDTSINEFNYLYEMVK